MEICWHGYLLPKGNKIANSNIASVQDCNVLPSPIAGNHICCKELDITKVHAALPQSDKTRHINGFRCPKIYRQARNTSPDP